MSLRPRNLSLMHNPNVDDVQLESAIANLYNGPLDDFVQQRDALAKQLRSDGKREAASMVKNARKPSRVAWILDKAAHEGEHELEALVAAVDDTLAAQNGEGDIRETIVRLRAAVREFAGVAARVAERTGYSVESSVLANAALAVAGNPEYFSQLRRGCVVDIPPASGIDFFTAIAPPDKAKPQLVRREPPRQIDTVLQDARKRLEDSQRALLDAEAKLHAAEQRLRDAEDEVSAARKERDRARAEADAARYNVIDAD
jgi:exonuclease VII small subunit